MHSQERTRKLKRCLMLAKCNQGYLKSAEQMLLYRQGNAGQATNRDNQNIQHPQEVLEGTRKGPFHCKPHKLHQCRKVLRLWAGSQMKHKKAKEHFRQALCLTWSNFSWLSQEEKSCPGMLPSKHDQTAAKLNHWFCLLILCWRRQRQRMVGHSLGEKYSYWRAAWLSNPSIRVQILAQLEGTKESERKYKMGRKRAKTQNLPFWQGRDLVEYILGIFSWNKTWMSKRLSYTDM